VKEKSVGTGYVHAMRSRLTKSSFTLVASLVAAAVFAIALLVGWATAGTREDLRRAPPLPAAKPPPRLVQLGAAARLPAAPPSLAARKPNPRNAPRLIVGSG
jgi:hypothetical protein